MDLWSSKPTFQPPSRLKVACINDGKVNEVSTYSIERHCTTNGIDVAIISEGTTTQHLNGRSFGSFIWLGATARPKREGADGTGESGRAYGGVSFLCKQSMQPKLILCLVEEGFSTSAIRLASGVIIIGVYL